MFTCAELKDADSSTKGSGARMSHVSGMGAERTGLEPFVVSHRPGAYGRLLLAVYVRWKSGLLVKADWLRLVTQGGWRASRQSQCAARLTSAD